MVESGNRATSRKKTAAKQSARILRNPDHTRDPQDSAAAHWVQQPSKNTHTYQFLVVDLSDIPFPGSSCVSILGTSRFSGVLRGSGAMKLLPNEAVATLSSAFAPFSVAIPDMGPA